ncbi:DUF2590 family protein [Moritella sp. Urea-trap-13]|uniref:DUF2590 family protein n=1 Tax=Moritella sp. Urea-trap-13 TaxID=2058327 RepID=UPI000C325BDF|nr:DUF2590 family protein [Moritella sp. Urea-trap-13]PKH06659.1 DUF2590 domain-containing protein [Moritella sp. Urea-trap-13]
MTDKYYIDLLVNQGGVDFDAGQQPRYTNDIMSIAQDVKHAVLESGLVRLLQAERNRTLREDVLTRIEMLIEIDLRIEPGSASALEQSAGAIMLRATTVKFGELALGVTL